MIRMTRSSDAIAIPIAVVKRIAVVVVAIALAVGAVALVVSERDPIGGVFGTGSVVATGVSAQIDRDRYQAVFLTSGQIFFGRAVVRGDALLLRDIYYLSNATNDNPQGELLKRGAEIHAPAEPMIIPTTQVLFIENLRDDGAVVSAIKRAVPGAQGGQPRPAAEPPRPSLPQATVPASASPSGRP